jgi:hypothetical protein
MKSILCFLGLHKVMNFLAKAGESWAEPGKIIVMRGCNRPYCHFIIGYVRDATPIEKRRLRAFQ